MSHDKPQAPKQFWIMPPDIFSYPEKQAMHVIEHSAYGALLLERDGANEAANNLANENLSLSSINYAQAKEIDELKEAIGYLDDGKTSLLNELNEAQQAFEQIFADYQDLGKEMHQAELLMEQVNKTIALHGCSTPDCGLCFLKKQLEAIRG